MDLSNEDVLNILKIIDESGYNDIRLEIGDLKLHVQKEKSADASLPFVSAAPVAAAVNASSALVLAQSVPPVAPPGPAPVMTPSPAAVALAPGEVAVSAPLLGIFYRAPSPGEKPFVEVGQKVKAEDTICLIEVMKLFNSVKAGVSGTVTRVLVENGKMVEHGQVLIHIRPDA
jgi:acetyl-CoA carboxylase biotin carboxyl carrier protein